MQHIATGVTPRPMGTVRSPQSKEYAEWRADAFNSNEGSAEEKALYDCPLCKNRTQIAKAKEVSPGNWMMRIYNCKCTETRRSIKYMERSGLKNVIREYTMDKFITESNWQMGVKQAAMEYAKHPEGWFFIGGQSGAGKTHICTAICREFLLEGKQVVYMLWRDEAVRLKGCVNNPEEYRPIMDRLKRAEVLYIDDLFKTGKSPDGTMIKPTAADINLAFELLNFRYADRSKLTIISSECTAEELLRIDEAVAGRILERANVLNLMPDPDKNFRLRRMGTSLS